MSKADLVVAQRGDFKVFDKIDKANSSSATMDEFLRFIEKSHSEKRAKRIGAGDRWYALYIVFCFRRLHLTFLRCARLKTFLHSLEKGLEERAQEEQAAAVEAARKDISWEAQVGQVLSLYTRISRLDGGAVTMSEMALTLCQRYDFGLFEKIASDRLHITQEEWLGYLRGEHGVKEEKKEGSGDRWLQNFLITLEANLSFLQKEEQKALAVYRQVAAMGSDPERMSRSDLYAVYEGDEYGEKAASQPELTLTLGPHP